MIESLTPLVFLLPALLVMSSFFSGSETALFGLSHAQRRRLHANRPAASRAVDRLLARPRELLITLMIGNMAANVTYFVVTSVLALRAPDVTAGAIVSFTCLAAMILLGEVAPKLIATGARETWCATLAIPIAALHQLMKPLRAPVAALIEPLSRLAPAPASRSVTHDELAELLDRSATDGTIELGEARLLEAVAELSAMRATDVMTPRVHVRWTNAATTRTQLAELLREKPVARVIVCEKDLDDGVLGVLETATFFASASSSDPIRAATHPAVFVPESAPLDRVLETLHQRRESLAVVVDEFGGISGIVTAADIVSRLVGENIGSTSAIDEDRPTVEELDTGDFRVPGRLPVRDWQRVLGLRAKPNARTVSGVVMELLGRAPQIGDTVTLGPVTVTVESLDGRAVGTAIISADALHNHEPKP